MQSNGWFHYRRHLKALLIFVSHIYYRTNQKVNVIFFARLTIWNR